MQRAWQFPWMALAVAALLSACASNAGQQPGTGASGVLPQSYTQSGSTLTITGTVTAIISSTEFSVYTGSGCGSIHVYTNSSTVFTPSGAKAAVGDATTDSGTGSCATYLTASSVQLSTPSPSPSPTSGATPTPSPMPASYTVGYGEIFGLDNAFSPNDGDTSSGGVGQTIDGMPCATTMPNTYHVHAFVGIIINGRQLALPDGTGMDNPGGDGTYSGIPNWTEYATCYYYMHTHDASGVVHIESPQSVPLTSTIYNLGNYFDVWGRPLSSTQIGPYTGTVVAYVANVPLRTAQIVTSDYTQYTGDPRTIALYSHTTIWLETGPTYVPPSKLPVINYYMEY
jgi:hypothetical protein